MNLYRSYFSLIAAVAISFGIQSCAPKQLAIHPAAELSKADNEVVEPAPAVQEPEATPEPAKPAEAPKPAPVAEKPDYSTFKNILFEHDSHVLKTDSYEILDQIAREILKDPNGKFTVNGHASIEGGAQYNMSLSIDRANAVKIYLVNSGIRAENLTTEGFGATRPVASNDNETGRAKNRRVEVKVVQK